MHLQNGTYLSNVKREIKTLLIFHHRFLIIPFNSISSTLECLIVECELNGAMIWSKYVVINRWIDNMSVQIIINHKVIQSPSLVNFSSSTSQIPITVLHLCWIFLSERISPSLCQEIREACSFFLCKTSTLFVSFGLGYVDFFMANIQVTA